jgi:hypothetical protein
VHRPPAPGRPGAGRPADAAARRGRSDRRPWRRAPRDRHRGQHQEPDVLGGVRRLLDRPRPARARPGRGPVRDRAVRRRGGRAGVRDPGPADRPHRAARRPVELGPADTSIGSAGSTSASRQTWMSGGAVQLACRAVREVLLARAAAREGEVVAGSRRVRFALRGHEIVDIDSGVTVPVADLLADGPIDETREHHHAPTDPLDETGRATRTCRSRSRPTAPSSTSTPTSACSAWCRSRPARTSARRSTRGPSPARSRAASPRGSGSR